MSRTSNKVSSLENEVECLRDEIRYLKLDQNAKDQEIEKSRQELETIRQELQALKNLEEPPVIRIGVDVRMRYMEAHRRRMGLPPSAGGREAKKSGDRAAHRGRPLVDAWLYETGRRNDESVYEDLYGIPFARLTKWKEVSEVVDVCGYHASLKSDSGMTARFKELFTELFEAAAKYEGADDLATAFNEEKILLSKFNALQNLYDAIIAADPPRFRGIQSPLSP